MQEESIGQLPLRLRFLAVKEKLDALEKVRNISFLCFFVS